MIANEEDEPNLNERSHRLRSLGDTHHIRHTVHLDDELCYAFVLMGSSRQRYKSLHGRRNAYRCVIDNIFR